MTAALRLHENEEINIYPNPAEDIVNVVFSQDARDLGATGNQLTLEVFNLLGQGVHISTSEVGGSTHAIDVKNWPAGQYILQIKSGEKVWTEKLVVTNTNDR